MGLQMAQYIDSYLPAVDGVVTVVKNYARVLDEAYGSCCVVAPRMPGYLDQDPFNVYRFQSIKVPKRDPYRFGLPSVDVAYRRYIRDVSFDIIHAHSPFGAGREAARLARKLDVPLVATFHSKFYDDFKEATGSDRMARLGVKYVIRFFHSADYVWSVNAATAQTLRDYGYQGEITVVPNGTDVGVPADTKERRARVRQELKLGELPVFLFVGQMIWQKNLRLICESLARYKELGNDFRMVFVGTGVALSDLQALCRELGLEENTVFTGIVLDRDYLRSIFVAADLFLFPSIYDNAPLVVREAAAVCTPSLLIAGSNSAEGIAHLDNGFLCAETPQAICDTLCAIATDRPLLEQVGRRASETLPLGWDKVVKQVYNNYQEILKDWNGHRK